MNRRPSQVKVLWQSATILLILGIPAAVFANSISSTLSSKRPDWVYVFGASLLVISLVLLRIIIFLALQVRDQSIEIGQLEATIHRAHAPRPSAPRKTLADLVPDSRTEIFFIGILGKRSIADDSFMRLLEGADHRSLRLRFLFTNPNCDAFRDRAREERESVEAWTLDHAGTIHRLKDYKKRLDIDISVRVSDEYPIWRMIIIDNKSVWVNTFLPGKRGTESMQWELSYPEIDLTHGLIKTAEMMWKNAVEVSLQ